MQYVIIGNGIVALSTAFRLTQRLSSSDSIVVVGPADRPGSATLAAAAMLNSFGEIGATSLKSEYDMYHFELSHMATRQWPKFEEELIEAAGDHLPSACAKCEVLKGGCFSRGTFILNNSAADEWDDKNFNAILKALDDFDEPHELVNPYDIPNYYPSQNLRATRAVYIHNEGWLNPRIVLEKIDAILGHNDIVTVIDGRCERLIGKDNQIEAVKLESGDIIEGDIFLLATGATVSGILERSELGIKVQPVFYGVGVSLEIKSPDYKHTKCIRTPNRGGACGTYTVPYFLGPDKPDDHILIGASNRVRPHPVYFGRLQSIEHLMHSATHEINEYFYGARLIRINIGWRPTTQDTYPLLGGTSYKNFYIATGTKRDGFHLAPVISDFMAKLLMGQEVDERFKWFSPEREIIHDISREDGVDVIVQSLMSEQYQHGYRPSNPLMNKQLRESYRQEIEELHDKVGAKDWGIPPELVNMYRQGYTV
ncbi:MAG: FAD-dependent oxidoreductase [Candidatus Dadabacteria bacterium]|nr:MAG: FAD-dependent oxidoreductase [Candidatus Dadabacteria bacterium]